MPLILTKELLMAQGYGKELKSPKKGLKSNLDDPEFCSLFLRILSYRLEGREIKYLMWRFYYNKTDEEIAKLDNKKITRQAINLIIKSAYIKIKLNNG
jgi:hypothetical protein